jgi:hypothetical protein
MYDRVGRELCVAYQMQDMAVQQELRRLDLEEERGERDSRRSGVRLSAELPVGSDGTSTRPGSLTETQPPSLAEDREAALSEEASRLVRPSHMDSESLADIEVSATSHYPSVSASRTSSRPASARPSEFSIFRESAISGVGKARSNIPVRTIADEDRILLHRETGGGSVLRATSMPASSAAAAANHNGDSGRSGWRRWSEKRRRSRSSGGGRLSRVRFISEEADENGKSLTEERQQQLPSARAPGAAAPLPPRLPTPPPVPLSEPDRARLEDPVAPEEATRWTTLSRGSAAVRATKQLFRSTTHSSVNVSRMTTTLSYAQPIPSNVYGLAAPAITASKVREAVERNVAVCAAAMPQQYTNGADVEESGESRDHAPELKCGSVVQLGREWYRLVHFHVVAEVYEAVRVDAPVVVSSASVATSNAPRSREDVDGAGHDCAEVPVDATIDEQTCTAHSNASCAHETCATYKTAASREGKAGEDHGKAVSPTLVPLLSRDEHPPTLFATETAPPATTQLRQRQCFVYRWRASNLAHSVDEARRAALGLSLCTPHAHVTGFNYADGGGITVVTLPAGYHAVPVSALPLSLRSYTTLLRTVLKALSAMVARRTVHGNMAALGDLFLVFSVDDAPYTAECAESPRRDCGSDAAGVKARDPSVLLFHWEHWVDFGMYIDRNAGRTLPFDFEDGSVESLVYYSKDLLTGLQLFLEHTLAAELTSEQYILLQKLIVLAAEPAPVASHLIQLKNLMLTLPTDTAALQRSFEAALVQYTLE